jgi:signal transduction histidine kinase/DNA-binding response OmpR family regulator/ligand-binding sensor domain-containing protein
MRRNFLISLLLFSIAASNCIITAQGSLLPAYDIQSVSIGADLSSLEINKIFQDSNGFIWLGTETGISRYDGKNFINYSFSDGKKIANIYDIKEDGEARIWAVGKKGLFVLNDKSFIQTSIDSLPINAILIDHNNNLVIAGSSFTPKLISPIQTDSLFDGYEISPKELLQDEDWKRDFEKNDVWDLAEDNQNNIWIGLEHRLLKLHENILEEIWKSDRLEVNISEIMAISPDSVYWGNENTGLYFKNSKGISLIIAPCTYMMDRTDSTLLLLTTMDLLQLKGGLYDTLSTLDEFDHLYFRDILQDSEGNIWIAAEGSLLKLTKKYFHSWSINDTILLRSNHSVAQLKSDKILVGSSKKNILERKNNEFKLHQIPATHNSVTEAILEDSLGNLWYATSMSGLILETDNKFQVFDQESGLVDKTLFFISEDEFGRLWCGGDNGISQIQIIEGNVQFKNYLFEDDEESSPKFVNVVCISQDVCLAVSKNGIYKVEDGRLLEKEIHGIDDLPIISQVIKNKDGHLLLSTLGGGVLILDVDNEGKITLLDQWDKSDGLLSDNTLNLHIDKRSRTWVFYRDGTCVIEGDLIKCYDQRDGWFPLETTHIDLLETKDGVMWVVANSAITIFPLYDIPSNPVAPKVFITDVKLFEGRQGISKYIQPRDTGEEYGLVLPHNQNFLRFNFTSTSHTRNDKNTFVTQLEGLDQMWNLPTSSTFADYPGLKPGKYLFKVKAINNSGILGESIAEYPFIILRPWFSRWWAIVMYLAIFFTLAYYVYDLIASKKRKENEANRLRELNDFQTNFYTNITHEFRTPLTVIIGMTDQIKEKARANSAPIDHDLKMINRNAERLLNLIIQILKLSKLRETKPQLTYVSGDMIGFISQIIESLQSYAKANELSLYFYAEEEHVKMDFDEEAISAVLINLISNSIKNTNPDGKIIIHTKIENNGHELFIIKVKDDGKGIPESQLDHLFSRYSSSSQSHNESIGLGLAMTKQLIDLMGGQIHVSSTVGKGTEFIVKIPVRNKSVIQSVTQKSHPVVTNSEKQKIVLKQHQAERQTLLVVEDNHDVAEYIISCLDVKYNILYAENGKEGLTLALENVPDLIVSDVMMPEMNGILLCQNLKSHELTQHIPIILLSAKSGQNDKILGITNGADAYITKPFSKVELLTKSSQLLKRNKEVQESSSDINTFIHSRHEDPDKQFLQEAVKFIHANLHNEIYSPPFLARNLGISESQLYKKLKSITGKSTAIFIRSVRLDKSREMLLNSKTPISEIANRTGFKNASWFSRAFKNEYGYSPSEIRNK